MRYVFNPLTGDFNLINNGGAAAAWGSVTGTLSDQTDLQNALDSKVNKAGDTVTGGLAVNGGVSAGPTSGFGNAYSVVRDGVQVGRIDNNQVSGGGMRVQAMSGVLQLRGSANSGFLVGATGITSELPIDAGNNSVSSSFVPTSDNHLANKLYVDNAVGGLGTIESSTMPLVYEIATKNISMTTGEVGQVLGTIDDPVVGPAVAWTDAPGVAEAVADINNGGSSSTSEIEQKINEILSALRNAGLMET